MISIYGTLHSDDERNQTGSNIGNLEILVPAGVRRLLAIISDLPVPRPASTCGLGYSCRVVGIVHDRAPGPQYTPWIAGSRPFVYS
ncbi:hypothetical protein Sjap_024054 [Stephania japonica]|uniref:Uncharacterized protein n=1 Tax=Stephania japonica TaxID=461633 RepID=A0AAP0EFX5_9MAGN